MLALVGVYLLWFFLCANNQTVEIQNHSDDDIVSGTLFVSPIHYPVGAIGKGRSALIRVSIYGKSDYDLQVEFRSGKTRQQESGYLSRYYHSDDRLEITSNKIVLTQGSPK
jgi:hypothetical protein